MPLLYGNLLLARLLCQHILEEGRVVNFKSSILCAWVEFGFVDSEAEMADNFIKSLHGYADIHADDPVELLWQGKRAG